MNSTFKGMLELISNELKRVRSMDHFDEATVSALETLECSVQTLEQFAITIRSMRDSQQCYDVTGSGTYLATKLRLEKAVDELLKDIVVEATKPQAEVERIPDGTDVYLELGMGTSKSEFVDAVIIRYSEGKPCVQTSWGAVFNNVDPKRVQRREVAHA